jgi:hypothetical protein
VVRLKIVIDNRAGISEEALAELEDAVRDHTTLERVVRWSMFRSPRRLIDKVVKQDEYTLDVVLPLDDEGLCLVYDTT